jgi:gliding motility-associated-like protein
MLRSGDLMRPHFFAGAFFISLFFAGKISAQQLSLGNNSASSASSTGVNFTADPFTPYFVENKGQFDQYDADRTKSDFKSPSYGSQMGNAILLFNGSSVQFVENIIKNKENDNDGGKDKDLSAERVFETWRQTMNFVGADPAATFEVEESQSQYFTYPDPKIKNGTITANAWGKLICKNIYPGIDVEFTFKETGGIKYSFIVHPGADASLIQIKWSGVEDLKVDANGDLQMNSENGVMTDKAPSSFYQDEVGDVTSGFHVNGKTVSFSLGNYDHNKTLVIDPWVFSPALLGNNKAYDIQHDPSGNVYVYGGSNPYQLKKFTSAGAPIWTYNTAATGYYGDFVIDGAGNAFCVYGPWGDQCVKITPAGAMVWSVSQSSSREVYRVYPNPVNVGQLTIMGMGMPAGLCPMVLNINMTTGAYSGPWYHPTCTAGETRGMAVDVNGDAYGLVFSTGSANAPNNLLWKVNAANATVTSVTDGYLLWESQASNTDSWYSGYNGVAVGCFVYTYDGITVKKWDKTTLALLASAVVPGGVGYVTAGVCIDACGNVYVGGPNSIREYDANLGFLTSVATTSQVYDVNLGNVPGEILGCGNGFFGSYTFPVCSSSAISVTATPATCSACNGSATVTMNPAGAYTYSWSPTGGTGSTATALCAGSYTVTATLGCQTYTASIVVPNGGGGLTLSAPTITNVTCNGACNGSASITATTGTGPFTFTWSPAATNSTVGSTNTGTGLCAGTYTVTTTDAGGCTGTSTITITQPPVLTCTFSQVNPVCNGGTGTGSVVASGGTGPYTYNWTPSGGTGATSTAIPAGNYTCTITDSHGCTTTHAFVIASPSAVTCTFSQVNPLCNGGTGTGSVVASGGTGPYTYNWTPSGGTGATSTAIPAGNYTCTITDANGCTTTHAFVLVAPSALTNTFSQVNPLCNGGTGTASVVASGGTGPYTYAWTPTGGTGATSTPIPAGNYTCTITDANGCTSTHAFVLVAPSALTNTFSQVNPLCNGGTGTASVVVSGGTGPYTYAWTPSGGTGATSTAIPAGNYTCTITDANGCTTTHAFVLVAPSAVTTTFSQVNPLCNGGTGTASVVASGGTGPYTYNWTPSGGTGATSTAIPAGNYTCTITDANGCTTTHAFVLVAPSAVAATSSSTPATCGNSNGSASVVASGGTGPYTYNWAPTGGTGATASGLIAANYTCTITDSHGCSITSSVAVTNAAAPTATITASTNISCFGGNNGSATVSASGGTGPYTYAWTPTGGTGSTANSLTANTYTVTVTDANSCIATATVTLTQPPVLTATATSTPVLCNGGNTGTATVTASGGVTAYTYNWTPSGGTGTTASALTAATYTCTVTDANGCTTTATTTVTQPTALTASATSTAVLCNGGNTGTATVTASGGTGAYTYNWTPSGGTGSTASSLTAATYTCTVTDANGCTTTASTTVAQPAPLSASTTVVSATCGNANGSATVTASGGTGIYTFCNWAPTGGTGFTATGLVAGSYTVTITDSNGCTATATANVPNAGSPTATITASVNVSCFGGNNGSATVNASGGTGPYTYAWTPTGGTGSTGTALIAGNYTVTVTDANTCITTATVAITQPPALTASATSTPVLCNGGNTGTATVTAAGGVTAYTYNWTPSGGTGTTAPALTAATYTCTVTDANGCTITATTTVTQPTALTATAANTPVDCNGGNTGTATVTASGGTGAYTYNWSPIGGTGITAMNLTAQTYTCTVTDANGCTITATTTVTQPTPLTATTTTTTATCGNANGSATVTASGGTGPYTYSWSPSGGSGTTASNLVMNIYTVTVTDSKGCTVTATANVPNAGSPTATITASINVSCFGGNNGSATVLASGGTGPYTYAWSPSGGTGTTASALNANSYTVTVTDANTCSATATVTITQPPVLTASATSTPVLCNGGNTGSATVTATGGVTTYLYAWAPSGGTASTAPNLTAATYTCTVTDANGCTTTASATVTQPTVLATTSSQIDELCNGGNNASATVTPSGGTTPYVFAWSPSGGAGSTASSLVAGTYTCTISDDNMCSITQSFTIIEPNAIVVTLTETDAHCNQADGSANSTTVGGTGAYSYNWMPGNITTQNLTNVVSGTYTCTVTDANSCTGSATITINNLNGVVASIGSSTDILCFGQSTGAISVNQAGGVGPYTYTWSPNVSAAGSAANIAAGTYSITVSDASGCTSTTSVTLTQPPLLTVTASTAPVAVCNGTPVTITSTPGGGTPIYTVVWTPGNMNGNAQTLTPQTSGTYTVNVTDANGCAATATTNVVVNPVPVAAFSGTPLSGCAPVCVDFSDLSTVTNPASISSWSWNFGDNSPASTTQNPNHCYTSAGLYTVMLTVSTSDGCTSTLTMPNYIDVFGNPVAAFTAGPQPTTLLEPTISFMDQSTNASSWSWSFGDINNSTSTLQNPTFSYQDPMCYDVLLTVSNAQGCTDTVSHDICIGPDATIYVPNAFTPNSDGNNDVFNVVGLGLDPDQFEMWIFDRWGNLIFSTTDLNKGWDGKVNGGAEIAQIDTYVWKVKAKDITGASHNLIGKVSLIK